MNVRVLIRSKSGEVPQEVLVPAEAPFVLGRGSNSAAPLDGPGISREHLAVGLEGNSIVVTDLSVNGAWVNGKRLPAKEKYRVKPSEVVELPGYELEFQPVSPPQTPAAVGGSGVQTRENPASAPAVLAAPSKGFISSFIGSFSFLEKVLVLASLLTFVLAAVYYTSF